MEQDAKVRAAEKAQKRAANGGKKPQSKLWEIGKDKDITIDIAMKINTDDCIEYYNLHEIQTLR